MSELEARLWRLEQEREIVRTLHQYAHAIDYGDDEAWVDCFTEDAHFAASGGVTLDVRGREALRRFIARHSNAPSAWHKHLMIEPLIELDGDTAACTSYLALLRDDDGVPAVGLFGRYRDRLVLEPDGRWRFAERLAEVEVRRAGLAPLVLAEAPSDG